MSLKKDILWRIGIVYLGIFLFALLIFGRIFYLQFFEKHKWKNFAQKQTLKNITIEANRGDIYDENGRSLATSVPHYEVRLDFQSDAISENYLGKNIDSLALCLSRLFRDKTEAEYRNLLLIAKKSSNRYFLLKKNVTYDELKQLKTFPIFRRGQYKGGLICIKKNQRIRPHGILAARTIGYTTQGESGNIVGIEGAYDHYLKGVEGIRLMHRLSGGVWMPLNENNEVEPKNGMDVVSTINVNIQDVAENALYRQLKLHEAHHGCAVLMEVKTGRIRAIVNLERDENGNYNEHYNYAIGESTEPGSTFKLPALMAAIEDGYVDLGDTINTGNGVAKYYDLEIKDSKKGGHGRISVKRVFEISSNVGMSSIINDHYKNNPRRFIDRLYRMNLNQKAGISIKGEGKPYIKYPGDPLWSGVSLPMMSFGYEVRLTPLQILTFYNAVANNGKMVKPRLVDEIRNHGKTTTRFNTEVLNPSICSFSTIKKAKKILEGVVENGTAENLGGADYKIAGKTGTVKLANKEYGYQYKSKASYQASFVGYFPADKPAYSCIVVVNSPSKNVYYGNLVAGPVFKEIADKVYATSIDIQKPLQAKENKEDIIPYTKSGYKEELETALSNLNIPVQPDKINSQWVVTAKKETHVGYKAYKATANLVPNVKGMGLKDALFLLENAGLEVEVEGRGTVIGQSIEPGRRIIHGQRIILTMSINSKNNST